MSTHAFSVTVLSPTGSLFSGSALSLTLPTEEGEITVLAHHAPVAATLGSGEAIIRHAHGTDSVILTGGMLEVTPGGHVRLLADLAMRSDAVSADAAAAARALAEKQMQEAVNDRDYATAQKALVYALTQLRIAGRKNRH